MTNNEKIREEKRKELDKLAESVFPNLSLQKLVDAALEFERTLK